MMRTVKGLLRSHRTGFNFGSIEFCRFDRVGLIVNNFFLFLYNSTLIIRVSNVESLLKLSFSPQDRTDMTNARVQSKSQH